MTNGPEKFIVVWFGKTNGEIYALADSERNILVKESAALKGSVHGVLSTEEEIEDAEAGPRYAVPVDLAREVFGWDI